jgi:O-antigen/teichoic acid export membrane protein
MKNSVQVIRNVFANWGSYFIGTVVGFLMMPFVVHQLGDVRYGIWILVLNFTGYLGLLDLGIGGTVVKYVAEFKGKKDATGLNEVCSTVFYFYLISGILAFLFAYIIALYFIPFFKIPLSQLPETRSVTIIVGLEIGLSLPLGFFSGYMRGIQRYDLLAIISMTSLLIRSLFIVIFLLNGHGLITLALIHLIATVFGGIIMILYVYRTNPDLKLRIRLINKENIRLMSQYSLFIFLYFGSLQIIFAIGSLVIGYFLMAAAVTYYAIPQRLVEYVRILIMATAVVLPTVSYLNVEGQTAKIQKLLINGTKYALMIALPVGASYIIVGKEFLSLWFSNKYSLECYPVLAILTFGIIAHVCHFASVQVLQGLARHRVAAYVSISEAIANIALSIILVHKYGIVGVAMGTAIPMIITNSIVIPWYSCRVVGISWFHFLSEAYVKPFLCVIFFVISLYTILKFIPVTTWLAFVSALSVPIVIYCFFAWLICLSKSERVDRVADCRAIAKTMFIRS